MFHKSFDTHRNYRTVREPPLLLFLPMTYAHAAYAHTAAAHQHTRWLCVPVKPVLSKRSTQETVFFFYCFSLIMTYLFRTRDQCTTQALSQQEEKVVEPEKEWVLTSCRVYWPSLTVPLSSLHAYLDWEENRHWLLLFIWSHVLWRSPLLAVAQTAVFITSWKEGNYQTKKT